MNYPQQKKEPSENSLFEKMRLRFSIGNTLKLHVGTTNVETIMAWRNNQLIIENENYLNVFRKLENWYGVKFNFENSPKTEPNYSMTIKTESLREILELMSIISPIKYDILGEDVAIKFRQP